MMLSFSLFKPKTNDRAIPNALYQPVSNDEADVAHWVLRPQTCMDNVHPQAKANTPDERVARAIPRAMSDSAMSNSAMSGRAKSKVGLRAIEDAQPPPCASSRTEPVKTPGPTDDKSAVETEYGENVSEGKASTDWMMLDTEFNESKIPRHAYVDDETVYRGLTNRATKNPQFFLGDDVVVPSLLDSPQQGEYDLAVASQNVLDPTAAWWDNNILAGQTASRINKLAGSYARADLGIVAAQESSTVHQAAFERAGFAVINPDNLGDSATPVARIDSTKRQAEQAELREKGLAARSLHAVQAWKCDWRGLNIFYKPEQFQPHPEHDSEFRMFSDANQKGWSHIIGELPRLFQLTAKSLWSWQLPTDALTLQFMRTRNAFSGVARKDGILVGHLQDKKTGRHLIVCDTHWESFDVIKRNGQREEYLQEIQHLRDNFPEATLVLAGDFNRPQLASWRGGIAYDDLVGCFKSRVNAHSMPLVQMTESYPGQAHLDGVYVIPAKHELVQQTQGRTLKPYSLNAQIHEHYEHFTDHSAVVLNARLAPNSALN